MWQLLKKMGYLQFYNLWVYLIVLFFHYAGFPHMASLALADSRASAVLVPSFISCSPQEENTREERIRYKNAIGTFKEPCLSEAQTRICKNGFWSSWEGKDNFTNSTCQNFSHEVGRVNFIYMNLDPDAEIEPRYVQIHGDHLYVLNEKVGLTAIDMAIPDDWKQEEYVQIPNLEREKIFYKQLLLTPDNAYMFTEHRDKISGSLLNWGLTQVDISVPAKSHIQKQYKFPLQPHMPDLTKDHWLSLKNEGYLLTFDELAQDLVSIDLKNPQVVAWQNLNTLDVSRGSALSSAKYLSNVARKDNYLYLWQKVSSLPSLKLAVFDVGKMPTINKIPQTVETILDVEQIIDVQIVEDYAYILGETTSGNQESKQKLFILDVFNPDQPRLEAAYEIGPASKHSYFKVIDGYAYVINFVAEPNVRAKSDPQFYRQLLVIDVHAAAKPILKEVTLFKPNEDVKAFTLLEAILDERIYMLEEHQESNNDVDFNLIIFFKDH